MHATSKFRLRQSIGIVAQKNKAEFFRSNTRTSISLKIKTDGLIDFLKNFNGENSFFEIFEKFPETNKNDIEKLAFFLFENYIFINHDENYSYEYKVKYYRIINLFEDFFHHTSEVIKAIENLEKSRVMIIGLGAVGSHIALHLARSGVKNFVVVDADVVDISNIHRQAYDESDIGNLKTVSIKKNIENIASNVNIRKIEKKIDEFFFIENNFSNNINLIINCADEPSVDYTSSIIAKYCMHNNIPHIIGGGYNLHLTLIGQTIVPKKTSCYKCFETKLNEINSIEFFGVKRLNRDRKLGSFSPLSGIAASLASLEAIKLLIGAENFLQHTNKRIEFNSKNKNFTIIDIPKNNNCTLCGDI